MCDIGSIVGFQQVGRGLISGHLFYSQDFFYRVISVSAGMKKGTCLVNNVDTVLKSLWS